MPTILEKFNIDAYNFGKTHKGAYHSGYSGSTSNMLLLKLVEAKFLKNLDAVGKMDP